MRLTAYILLAGSLHLSAAIKSQTISFSGSNVSMHRLFQEIKKQTGYFVAANKQLIASARPVTITADHVHLVDFLNRIMEDQPLTYSIKGKNILLSARPPEPNAVSAFPFLDANDPPITLRGRITNEKGEPVIATIVVEGTDIGTTSDADGYFILKNVNDRATLIVSGVSIDQKTVALQGSSSVNIVVTTRVGAQEEVVVNAGYYKVSERLRTGNISRITSSEIEKQPVTNMLSTMQGRMAGVNIVQNSGVPGSVVNIEIRGRNSLRQEANAPLYVIDGIPYSSETMGHYTTSNILIQSSPLNSINPAEIESIEVLKDADATAIYGSRGANGVVLITTKRGKSGGTRFSATLSRGGSRIIKMLDMLSTSEYIAMRKEAFENDGQSYGPGDYDVNGTWDQDRYTNWEKELIGGTANFTDAQVSLSGGSLQTQFLISGSFNHQTSVYPGDFPYRKGGGRISLNHISTDQRLRLSLSVGYSMQNNRQPAGDITREAMQLAPNAPALYDDEGRLNWENSTWVNPLAAFNAIFKANTSDLLANTQLGYQLGKSLELKLSLGLSDSRNDEVNAQPHTIYDPVYQIGSEYSTLSLNNSQRKSWIAEPQITWKKTLNKLRFETLLGSTFQQQSGKQFVNLGAGFSSNSLIFDLASAFDIYAGPNTESVYKYQAVFGRLNMNWNNRLIINLTGRRDGSSRFGPGRQFANFGAIGAAWIFSEEAFFKDIPVISFGKIRASYGSTGSDQIGDYQFLNTYATRGENYNGITGLAPSRLLNENFGWETNRKLELAMEVGLLRDRLLFTASVYRNRSSNQLVGIPLPATTGFTTLQANLAATVQNQGLELTLRSVNIMQKHFNWTSNFNLSIPRNKLISFPGLETSTYKNSYIVGYPLRIQQSYDFTGIDPTSGVYTFRDFNSDGRITATDDRKRILDFNPVFFGGWQNQITYKKLQIEWLFQFVKQLTYDPLVFFGIPGTQSQQLASVLDRWQKPGDNARHQKFTTGAVSDPLQAFYSYYGSDASMANGSFLRLKTVSIGYTLAENWGRISNCRLSVQAQNLLTITSFSGRNPESNFGATLPAMKVVTAGVTVSF